ncbi:hypothetical protein RRG08_000441 [Elysia crispata]|uniref:Uncharacterized protein n=1 Tax=Elysia crispata TaxID=231223 RepID=A0AAE1CWA4_9GAST|nr:hypothetical protein RRG08_000441 [Elysia crispata]
MLDAFVIRVSAVSQEQKGEQARLVDLTAVAWHSHLGTQLIINLQGKNQSSSSRKKITCYQSGSVSGMASNDHHHNCNVEQPDGIKRRSTDGGRQSPPFSPTHAKLPRHIPNADLDEELMKAGESLHHSVLSEDSAPARFELPRYPIQEKESREYFERQLSHRLVVI